MNFDEETLLEIEDYIKALDESVGLKPETVLDVQKAIIKKRKQLQEEDELMKKELNEVYELMEREGKEMQEHNQKILEDNKIPLQDFEDLIEGCDVTDKIEIVNIPHGDNQYECYGVFKEIFVDQWSTGMEGDSYAGYIYGKLDKDKWIKVPYSC
jgi:hypothetical protein